jgi:hypothetical protein
MRVGNPVYQYCRHLRLGFSVRHHPIGSPELRRAAWSGTGILTNTLRALRTGHFDDSELMRVRALDRIEAARR